MAFGMFNWSAGDLGSAMLETMTNWIAGEERKSGVDPASVQNQYNQQRNDVRSKVSNIGFQGEYRPHSVNGQDDFDKPSTKELRDKVDKIDITAVDNLANAWTQIGTRAETSLTNFTNAMKRATDEGIWSGASRNAVAKAVSDYGTEAVQLANAAKLTANKVLELKTGLEPTKALVPHAPELRSNVENARHWIAGRGWRNNDEAENTAHAEAVRVLKTVYAPVIKESDTNVPVIPKPTNPTSNNPTDEPTGGTPTPSSSKNPSTNQPSNQPTDTDPQNQNPSENPSTNPQSTQQDSSTSPQSTSTGSQQQNSKTDSPATNPAGTNPSSANPSSGTPRSGTPRSGSPGSGSPGSGSPSAGRSVAASPVAAGVSAGSGTSASAANAGRNGMGGMGSPGSRGGGKDDESTKGIPDYLINQQNGEELTGLDSMPGTVPPVIGE
ncbi:hypothetical protein [Nocardia sp. NPDC050710]|uniref:hypothetical protein n=1 Tax=Nocardia sp. NPDC050710 TaxID=3157220 RepID=UPI0033FC0C39